MHDKKADNEQVGLLVFVIDARNGCFLYLHHGLTVFKKIHLIVCSMLFVIFSCISSTMKINSELSYFYTF